MDCRILNMTDWSSEEKALLPVMSGLDINTIQTLIFTLCCLFLVYTSVGIGGSVYIEWRQVSHSATEPGSEATYQQRRLLLYVPLLIGMMTYLVTVYLYVTGSVSDKLTSWAGLASGVFLSSGIAVLLLHDLLYGHADRGLLGPNAFLSFDDEIRFDTDMPADNNVDPDPESDVIVIPLRTMGG